MQRNATQCNAMQRMPSTLISRIIIDQISFAFAGKTWVKPVLNLIEFDGSKANNIVAGTQMNSSSVEESIEPGTVFIDENPDCSPAERFKMVITWGDGATMFASADGYDFKNMTAKPLLKGSDSQDVVFWDHRVDGGAYVYYGRSHLKGGQNESCSASLGGAAVAEPGRSVNHFVIGQDVLKWPISSADQNATELTVLNTDALDPPCVDIYTNQATPLGDAYFFFPMMWIIFLLLVLNRGGSEDCVGRLQLLQPLVQFRDLLVHVPRHPHVPAHLGR